MDKDLIKHAGEFRKAIDQHQYEVAPNGLYFPKARALVKGVYVHTVNGQDERVDDNLLTTEGMNHMLSVTFAGGTQTGTWYLALWGTNTTPAAGWTAATFPATAGEITSATEGYGEAGRVAFVEATPASGAVTNSASKADFTIVTASTLTVYGAAVTSVQTKGATTGVLMSAARFAAVRTLQDDDVFSVGYTLTLSNA